MKFVIFLLFTIISFLDVKSQSLYPTNPDSLGRLLCKSINLNLDGLQKVKSFANVGKYDSALFAWRDFKVTDIRKNYMGPFGWHSNQLNSKSVLPYADYMAKKITQTVFLASACPDKNEFVYFGFNASPDSVSKTNWLAKNSVGVYPDVYADFYNLIPLASQFYKTNDQSYLKRWFRLLGDFSCNQKRLIDSLDAKTRSSIACNWSINAGPALAQALRVQNIIKALGVICKSLPNSGKPALWDSIYYPLNVPTSTHTLIPPIELSQTAFSLVFDHTTALKNRFFQVGAVPNQRLEGLTALLMIATQFPEFTVCNTLLDSTYLAIDDYLNGVYYSDGGMLEQSFNYNLGDAEALGDMILFLSNKNPVLSQKILSKQTGYYRLSASLRTPIGDLPAMSSQSPANPTAVWRDTLARKNWINSNYQAIPGKKDTMVANIASQFNSLTNPVPLPYTSINFPYSGYYVQRKNWNWDSHYLFFQDCRPARGHVNMGRNAIQVSAFGRPLLVSAGPPVYDTTQLISSLVPDFNAINTLLDEKSSLKTNTVIVDGKSQSVGTVAQTVYPTPIDRRWLSSVNFDFLEGNYDLGYPNLGSVNHRRHVIFVKDLGCWIVSDIMSNLDKMKHSFSQIWNFPAFQDTGKLRANGFKQNQVVLSGQNIYTRDSAGPNIWIYQVGGKKITNSQYFGQRNPYLGWFSPSFGSILPASQVFSTWSSSSHSVMTTLIWPTKNYFSPPISSISNTSDSNTNLNRFTVVMNDGRRLEYQLSYNIASLNNSFRSFTAQSLLTFYSANGTAKGLVLGESDSLHGIYEFNWAAGQFTRVSGLQTLPLSVISFSATQDKNAVVLKWLTNESSEIEKFIVQRSTDGLKFDDIGTIYSWNLGYSFYDVQNPISSRYYRLKIIGKNGTNHFSQVVFLSMNHSSNLNLFKLYPNPVKGILNIKLENAVSGNYTLSILNAEGKKVLNCKKILMSGGGNYCLQIGNLANGVYTIELSNSNGEKWIDKMIKE